MAKGKKWKQWQILFYWAWKSLQTVTPVMKLKDTCSLEKKAMTNIDSVLILKSRDISLPTKVCIVKAMFVPVVMYKCESWAIKKAECWRIDAFELWCWRRLLSLLHCKEIKPVNPKGNQPWIFIGKTGDEAPIFLPLDVKSWLIRKDPDAGKDWKQKEKGAAEDGWAG